MNKRLEQEIKQQWKACDNKHSDTDYLVAEMSESDFSDCAHHFYNLALADVRVEIERWNCPEHSSLIEHYLEYIDNLTK